jgi:hypothetical protein
MQGNSIRKEDRKRERNLMADWAMFFSLPSIEDPLQQYEVAKSERLKFKDDFDFLVEKKCTPFALETALRVAKTIGGRGMPKAARVKRVAAKMRVLADEISRLEASYFLIAQEFEEIRNYNPPTFYDALLLKRPLQSVVSEFMGRQAKMDDRWGVAAQTVHDSRVFRRRDGLLSTRFPHFLIPDLLNRRASMYDDWLERAQNKIPPRSDLLGRVKRMCPVLYVKWATGGNCFCTRVANLLRYAGIVDPSDADGRGLGGTQLNRELMSFESDYRLTTSEITRLLKRVHQKELTWPTVAPAETGLSRPNPPSTKNPGRPKVNRY